MAEQSGKELPGSSQSHAAVLKEWLTSKGFTSNVATIIVEDFGLLRIEDLILIKDKDLVKAGIKVIPARKICIRLRDVFKVELHGKEEYSSSEESSEEEDDDEERLKKKSTGTVSTRVPKDLPVWDEYIRDVRIGEFLNRLETQMILYGLKVDENWMRLSAACIPDHLRQRVQVECAGKSWTQGRKWLCDQLVTPALKQKALANLQNMKFNFQMEVSTYRRKFVNAMSNAGVMDGVLAVDMLKASLPNSLRVNLNVLAIAGPVVIGVETIFDQMEVLVVSGNQHQYTQQRERQNENRRRSYYCKNHGKNFSHDTTQCRGSSRTFQRTNNNTRKGVCFKCRKPGHFARQCPLKGTTSTGAAMAVSSSLSSTSSETSDSSISTTIGTSFMSATSPLIKLEGRVKAGNFVEKVELVIDSGCSNVLVNQDLANRLQLRISKGRGTKVTLADNSSMEAKKTDEIVVELVDGRCVRVQPLVCRLPCDVLLGLSAWNELDLFIGGLPGPSEDLMKCIVEDEKEFDTKRVISKQHVPFGIEDFDSLVKDAILRNEKVCNPCTVETSKVKLNTEVKSLWVPQYPLPKHLEDDIQHQVDTWEKEGIVQRISHDASRFNNPLTVAPKAGSKFRLCLDTSVLNSKLTDVEVYRSPDMLGILQWAANAIRITHLDLVASYTQLQFSSCNDELKTAFTAPNQQRYIFVRCIWGLKPMSYVFQRTMDTVLASFPNAKAFIDDVIICTFESDRECNHMSDEAWDRLHAEKVNAVINQLTEKNLRINQRKCVMRADKIYALGRVLSNGKISVDPQRIQELNQIQFPSSGKAMMSFLSTTNFIREFIPNYSTVVQPLQYLRDPGARPNKEAKEAFEKLKCAMRETVDLFPPDFDKPFFIATDASNVGLGAILYQKGETERRIIQLAAKTLNKSQQNYPANRRELLGLVFALKRFESYIRSAPGVVTVFTDHKALMHLNQMKTQEPMLKFWAMIIGSFNVKIKHVAGVLNEAPDCLSRLFGRADQQMKSPSCAFLVDHDSEGYKQEMLQACEMQHQLTHSGANAIVDQLVDLYGFERSAELKSMCSEVVSQCTQCLRTKVVREGFKPLTMTARIQPWKLVSMDLFGPMPPSSNGDLYVLVLVDSASRFTILRSIPSKKAVDVAFELFKICCEHGFMKVLRSDRGREFHNKLIDEMENFGIQQQFSPAYSPRSNGSAEIHVKLARELLSCLLLQPNDYEQVPAEDWHVYLPLVEFGLNQRIPRRNKSAPFAYYFGRNPSGLEEIPSTTVDDTVDALEERKKVMQEIIWPALYEKTENYINAVLNRTHRNETTVEIGDLVLVRKPPRAPKCVPTYSGPYRIISADTQVKSAFHLFDMINHKMLPTPVTVTRLKLASKSTPDEEYVVEQILDHRFNEDLEMLEYRVSWLGFDEDYDTWEAETMFKSSDGTVSNAALELYKNQNNL